MDNTNNTDNEVYKTDPPCQCERPETETNPFAQTLKDGMSKVFSNVKTVAITVFAAISLVLTGCKSLPTVEKMETTANLIGTSAGMVVNMTKIDAKSKAVVIDILKIAETTVPQTNQTFTQAWTPIAKERVEKLVSEGKIDAAQGELIITGFGLACSGIDYVFDVKYPKAREYKELVEAAIHGFVKGFTSVVNVDSVKSAVDVPPYDKDAFDFLKAKIK